MTVELDALVVSLRADTKRFRDDIARVRNDLGRLEEAAQLPERAFAQTVDAATSGNDIIASATRETLDGLEQALQRFAATGRLSFGDLRDAALGALADIARAVFDLPLPGLGGGGGIGSILVSTLSSFLGRASGGPVTPNRPFLVGERGPELLIPRTAGEVVPDRPGVGGGASRPISITVNVSGPTNGETARQSGTQVALAVRRALRRAERFS